MSRRNKLEWAIFGVLFSIFGIVLGLIIHLLISNPEMTKGLDTLIDLLKLCDFLIFGLAAFSILKSLLEK